MYCSLVTTLPSIELGQRLPPDSLLRFPCHCYSTHQYTVVDDTSAIVFVYGMQESVIPNGGHCTSAFPMGWALPVRRRNSMQRRTHFIDFTSLTVSVHHASGALLHRSR